MAACTVLCGAAQPIIPVTFGNGIAGFQICESPTTVLEHTLSASAVYGLASWFWTTGGTDNVLVEYYIDGEANASVAFQPSLACGQGFPQYIGSDPTSPTGLFSAGSHIGKAGSVAGWYMQHKIPFYASLRVQTRTSPGGGCVTAYMQVRGFEVLPGYGAMEAGFPLSSGFTVPRGARMQLQQLSAARFPPLWFASMVNISSGYAGVLLQVSMALTTSPPANNYIEGCVHALTQGNMSLPGLVVGTGLEDYFASAYWFSAASGYPAGLPFQHASTGLLHFSRGAPAGADGVEQLSAYRYHDAEVLGFSDGGRLLWRIGDQTGKCGANGTDSPIGTPSAVTLTSYAWVYTWPNGQPVQPLPPLQQPQYLSYSCVGGKCVAVYDGSGSSWDADCGGPCKPAPTPAPSPGPPAVVGCADGECDAFCTASSTVHGCSATWAGSADLRAGATGKPCGGSLGPCATPADACAPGWALCLSNASQPGLDLAGFRAGMSAATCAGGDVRRYAAAMSHAIPAWSNLPPAPCPAAPLPAQGDNGCAADGWGAEPVCCGGGCSLPSCPNSVWVDGTHIHVDMAEGCGAVSTDYVDGVLCCKMT